MVPLAGPRLWSPCGSAVNKGDDPMSWTDERIEVLRRLWADGLSASQIATTLGGVSRNAVIGKIHRLGLSGRVKASQGRLSRTRGTVSAVAGVRPRSVAGRVMAVGAAAVKVVEREDEPVAAEIRPEAQVVPLHSGVTLVELNAAACRWPIGDPSDEGFRFCGARTAAGETYCRSHAELAFPGRGRKTKD